MFIRKLNQRFILLYQHGLILLFYDEFQHALTKPLWNFSRYYYFSGHDMSFSIIIKV